MSDAELMQRAIEEARNAPWPYGAVIAIDGQIVASAGSGDGSDNEFDPTAHAEVNAIRQACKIMKVANLSGKNAALYSSCEPCMLCMGAIWYAGIKRVVYGSSIEAANGFFSWEDLAIPPHTKAQFGQAGIQLEAGLLADEVFVMYREHSEYKKRQ